MLFALLLCAGWVPFLIQTGRAGIFDPVLVMLGGVFGVLAAGFVYDAAERLLGAGKGVYAIAVLASCVPSAIILSEPPLVTSASMLFVSSAALWLAARATAENVRESVVMLSLLGGITLAVFGFWPSAFLPLVALAIPFEKGKLPWTLAVVPLVVAVGGLLVNRSGALPFPVMAEIRPEIDASLAEYVLLTLPWLPWFAALLALPRRFTQASWPRVVILLASLLALANHLFDINWVGFAGAAAPFGALGVTALFARWFEDDSDVLLARLKWIALPTAIALTGVLAARIVKWEQIVVSRDFAVLAFLLAVLTVVGILKDARRWILAMQLAAGWLIGALWWFYPPGSTFEELSSESLLTALLPPAGILTLAISRLLFGRRMPRALRHPGPKHLFDGAAFRRFDTLRRTSWDGERVTLALRDERNVSFAIFGDVTGSEFPMSSRKSGYYAFRDLLKDMTKRSPEFVISTGDLATRATHLAYRRVRMFLRHLPFPLLVTPGNHDLVDRAAVHAQFFHALFGADHGDLTVGPVRLILINNAWGSLADEQWTWVEETFAKPSDAAHTLVFCHKPVIDPREGTYYGMEWRPHAERLIEVFAQHKVTAVFSGHIHSLLHTERDGVHYIISGGGGSKLKSDQDTHHYLWCDATHDALRVTAITPDRNEPLFTLNLTRRT